jgi:hypothetical protein
VAKVIEEVKGVDGETEGEAEVVEEKEAEIPVVERKLKGKRQQKR